VVEDRTSREMHAKHIRVLEFSVCCPSIFINSYHVILIISSRSKMNMSILDAPFQVYVTKTTYLRFTELKKIMKKVTKTSLTLC